MKFEKFRRELLFAKAGRPYCYYNGILMRNRQTSEPLDRIAKTAWALHTLGKVLLFQQRTSQYACDYLLVPVRPLRDRDIDEAIALFPLL